MLPMVIVAMMRVEGGLKMSVVLRGVDLRGRIGWRLITGTNKYPESGDDGGNPANKTPLPIATMETPALVDSRPRGSHGGGSLVARNMPTTAQSGGGPRVEFPK